MGPAPPLAGGLNIKTTISPAVQHSEFKMYSKGILGCSLT